MLISVVIPVYNRPRLVARAVASVVAQTLDRWELIVVDDGSSDHTPEVLERLRLRVGERMRVVRQENRGVAAARNLGLTAGRGGLLALLDSDDEWLPRKLEHQAAYMGAGGHAVCQTQEVWLRGGRRVNPTRRNEKRGGRFLAQALETCLVSPSCVMFTQEFRRVVGDFDESLPACEDYDLWLRALMRYEIGLLDEVLTVRHGGRGDQISALYVGQDLFRIRALVKLLGSGLLGPGDRELVVAALEAKVRVYAAGCAKRGRTEEAARVMALAAEALGGNG